MTPVSARPQWLWIIKSLSGGDRRSIGEAESVAAALVRDPTLVPHAWTALNDADARVRMRAADALEKATRSHPELLKGRERALIALLRISKQQEVRWHLLQMAPRCALSEMQRDVLFALAQDALTDSSRIVAAEALGALFALAHDRPRLQSRAERIARRLLHVAAPSLQARARRLLRR